MLIPVTHTTSGCKLKRFVRGFRPRGCQRPTPSAKARLFLWLALATGAVVFSVTPTAEGQQCWIYTEGGYSGTTFAGAPIECVEIGSSATSCSWDSSCHDDGLLDDCCTTIPASGDQTVREMHEIWHNCFGSQGASDADNPPQRGQRWYAFHRQMEIEFNVWRGDNGLAQIESIPWCPGVNMPHGHFGGGLAPGDHPDGCGQGANRPGNVACDNCMAFPQCLHYGGAGPAACPTAPCANCRVSFCSASPFNFCCDNSDCAAGTCDVSVDFGYSTLEEFTDVEEIASLLDAYFHGQMHGAVGAADGGSYVDDIGNSTCSVRDPMFWRLHKALDDVVRAWQDALAVDVVLVLDESGSMSSTDASGLSTKIEAAKDAAGYFADFLDDNRSGSGTNRLAVVSYSSGATERMALTDASAASPFVTDDAAVNTTFETALNGISAGGCTSIGSGLEMALELLCPPSGDCEGYTPSPGENSRKAILLLTDGVENEEPCLLAAGGSGSGCGSQCFGVEFDYDTLGFTQVCSVGFGNSSALNGDLLTLLAERQGGIYMHNPDSSPENDLKKFFIMAYGQLTNEFLMADPSGVLAPDDAVSEPVEHTSCGDEVVTFASGWDVDIPTDDLQLIVTSPNGNLVRAGASGIQGSRTGLWDFSRIRLPHEGESGGTWRSQLIRPHRIFVNGFTPDSFAVMDEGVALVRREIQRLCPEGCKRVLYLEIGRLGKRSAYELALERELDTGLIGAVTTLSDADEFTKALVDPWDLIVYAYMGVEEDQPYDALLSAILCRTQRAILTDTRTSVNSDVLECAGVQRNNTINWDALTGDRRLVDGTVKFDNPGHDTMTYGLTAVGSGTGVQATDAAGRTGAIVVNAERGEELHWFISVLGRGLSKLDPHMEASFWQTGDDLVATVRILPSYLPAGGFDSVNARVEVEYPLTGIGSLVADLKLDQPGSPNDIKGESLDPRAEALNNIDIPTAVRTFELYDDGTHGDQVPGNAYWTATLTGLGRIDGMYNYRFILDFTVNGCTTRREIFRAVYVDINVKQGNSTVDAGTSVVLPGGRLSTPVTMTPVDAFGNLWGPGRTPFASCGPKGECDLDDQSVLDNGDGSYGATVVTTPGVGSVRLSAFGAAFDVRIPCTDCPDLEALSLAPASVVANAAAEGEIRLSGPAPKTDGGGALVYLSSSHPIVAEVPAFVRVPESQGSLAFPIKTRPNHDFNETDENLSIEVEITATYGGSQLKSTLTVSSKKIPGDGTSPTPSNRMCGFGAIVMLPLGLLGLGWLRVASGRRRRRR